MERPEKKEREKGEKQKKKTKSIQMHLGSLVTVRKNNPGSGGC